MTYANGFGHDPRRLHSVQRNVSSVRASSNANRVDGGVRIDTTPDPRGSICRDVRCTFAEHLRGLSSHIIAAAISRAGVTTLSIAKTHTPTKVCHGITMSAVESTSLTTAKPYGAKDTRAGHTLPRSLRVLAGGDFRHDSGVPVSPVPRNETGPFTPRTLNSPKPGEGSSTQRTAGSVQIVSLAREVEPLCGSVSCANGPEARQPISAGGSGGFIRHPLRPFIRFITSLTGQTFERPTCRPAIFRGGSSVYHRTTHQHDHALKVLICRGHLSSSPWGPVQ